MILGLHLLDAIVVVLYLLGITGLGIWTGRSVRATSEFFMPRRFGKGMMVMHAFGTGTASDQAVVVSSGTFRNGLSGIWFQWLWNRPLRAAPDLELSYLRSGSRDPCKSTHPAATGRKHRAVPCPDPHPHPSRRDAHPSLPTSKGCRPGRPPPMVCRDRLRVPCSVPHLHRRLPPRLARGWSHDRSVRLAHLVSGRRWGVPKPIN